MRVVLLFVPLVLILWQQWKNGTVDWTKIFDVSVVMAFLLLGISDAVVKLIQKKVAENTEDSAKLTDDYESLTKKYKCSDLVRFQEVVYPAECLWLRKGTEKILIEDNPEKFYRLPTQVGTNSREIMEAHSASAVYNQINIRLDDLKVDSNNQVMLETSRTQFFDSLLTNRACDYIFSDRRTTIRELFEPGPFLKPLSLSKLSNHLGFNGFVLTSDKKSIPFILRGKNLSIAKKQWGTSIGASLKTMYALDHRHGFRMTEMSLGQAIIGELADELNIVAGADRAVTAEKAGESIFAFYRDLVEGGKPQFLFCLELEDITEDELTTLIREKAAKVKKAKVDNLTMDGDEVRFFTLEQLRSAEFGVDRIQIEGTEYKMMPSSVVSVALMLRWMEK